MYSETVSTPTRSVRSRKSTHTPSPKDPNFPFIGVPGDVESYADGDEGAGSPQEIVLKHDVIPKASSSLLPFPPFPKASLPTGAVSPSQASFPTPTLSPFTTPAISPQATPAPSPLPPSVFATPPLPPAPPSATSAFSLTSSTLPPPYGTSGVAPLTAAEKGKGREPPRRFQEIIIPSPSDFTSSTSSTPALESAPIQSVTSSTALDPLPPLRSPRLPSTPRTPLTPISLNARLASNLADQLFQLATAPLVKSIASRTLSQQLIDNIEAEDASNERALQQFLSGASRRFASELIDKRVKRRASEALADEFASRKLKRRTLEGMWAAVLKGDERREREAEFEEKVEFMGLGTRRAVVDDLRGLQVGDEGREVRPNVDYKEVERRMTEVRQPQTIAVPASRPTCFPSILCASSESPVLRSGNTRPSSTLSWTTSATSTSPDRTCSSTTSCCRPSRAGGTPRLDRGWRQSLGSRRESRSRRRFGRADWR